MTTELSLSGKSRRSGKTQKTSYGSDWLDPSVSDTALSAAAEERYKFPVPGFDDWDRHDNTHWPAYSDMMELASRAESARSQFWGPRYYTKWSRPCIMAEYGAEEILEVESLLPRDMIHRHPDVDSFQQRWCRIMHLMVVDAIVSLQAEVLLVNGSAAMILDMTFHEGERVMGRKWREPHK